MKLFLNNISYEFYSFMIYILNWYYLKNKNQR